MNKLKLILNILTSKISSTFLKSIVDIFNNETQKLVDKILPEVVKIVTNLSTNNSIPGTFKQRSAFEQVTALLKKEGIESTKSFVNLIIELAVAQIKNKN
jgi:hypothetical protein